ncbi:MAG: NAD(P)H-dependent glycerol-3-phosphate dehydrogenase [Egibacteraceae bacterium]
MGKVAVMGAGSWGTAFALLCLDAGEDVLLWARRPKIAERINHEHRNPDYLADIDLGERLRATADAGEALMGAEVVVLAVPSHALRSSLVRWVESFPRTATAVSLIKGMELGTRLRPSEVVREVLDLPDRQVVVVSGPNFARECARRLPAGSVAAGREPRSTERVQAMCHTVYFRVYTNPDVVGVELGGAVKNVIAIAAGMADGMGYGDNAKATLVTRGLAEMARLGVALGGKALTFSGLAGVGDLVATCMSRQSRNRHVGEQLARGRSLDQITKDMNMVAEGVLSSRAIHAIAVEHGVDMPIVEQVVEVVHNGAAPADVAAALLGRKPKPELYGLEGAVS